MSAGHITLFSLLSIAALLGVIAITVVMGEGKRARMRGEG